MKYRVHNPKHLSGIMHIRIQGTHTVVKAIRYNLHAKFSHYDAYLKARDWIKGMSALPESEQVAIINKTGGSGD